MALYEVMQCQKLKIPEMPQHIRSTCLWHGIQTLRDRNKSKETQISCGVQFTEFLSLLLVS